MMFINLSFYLVIIFIVLGSIFLTLGAKDAMSYWTKRDYQIRREGHFVLVAFAVIILIALCGLTTSLLAWSTGITLELGTMVGLSTLMLNIPVIYMMIEVLRKGGE